MDPIITQVAGAWATNAYGFSSFVILVYDHLLTFNDEVEYMWKGRNSLVSVLFLVNRYITPFSFIINILAYTSSLWTPPICKRFVRFEGAMGYTSLSIVFIMMGIRVLAIYRGQIAVTVLLTVLFLAMVGVHAWLFTDGEPVPHKPGVTGCSMVYGPRTKDWGALSAWLPLGYETVIVFLVILRTRSMVRAKLWKRDRLVTTLIRDGILYYIVILSANLVLGIMMSVAPVEIRNINAQFQLIISVTMMSRITLNIRRRMENGVNTFTSFQERSGLPHIFVDRLIYGTLTSEENAFLSNTDVEMQKLPTAESTLRSGQNQEDLNKDVITEIGPGSCDSPDVNV